MRGAVAFSTFKSSWLSRAIRWFTEYEFSHSFIIADVCDPDSFQRERIYILEAGKREVSFNQLNSYEKPDARYEIWMPKGVSAEDIDRALYRTERVFLGKQYGYLQLVGFALVIALRKIGIRIKNPLKLGAICSEVDWYYCKQIKPEFFGRFDRDTVSPRDLREFVLHSGEFELVRWKEFSS
jgi:hypothetical protein